MNTELDSQLLLLEEKLQIDYTKEVEEENLFMKNELDCLEKREDSRLAQIAEKNG